MRRHGMTGSNGIEAASQASSTAEARRRRPVGRNDALENAQPQHSGDSVLAQIAALDSMTIGELRMRWRELFGADAPRHSRPYIVSRLAYRIQELAYGGLKPETLARLDALADEIDRELAGGRKRPKRTDRPIAGTQLIRGWRGVDHCITVRADGFEYQGRPYKSLSAIARAITGTRWNGWLFFGLKNMAKTSVTSSRIDEA